MSWPFEMPPSMPPRAIRAARELAQLAVVMDGVLHARAELRRRLHRRADLHALYRLDGDDGLRQAAIQPGVPGDVEPRPGGTLCATTSKTPPTVSACDRPGPRFPSSSLDFGVHAAEHDLGILIA